MPSYRYSERHADEEQYEGMDADDEDEEEGAQPATAASLGPQNGEEPQLETVREEEESMDEGTEPQLADMAKRRCARHTDSAVAISWSPQQPKVVVSGGCDDHAYLWTIDQEGALFLRSATPDEKLNQEDSRCPTLPVHEPHTVFSEASFN